MIDKKEAKKILSNVDSQHYFVLADGTHLKNIFELQNKLLSMDSSTFLHHVNKYKNDFANWILHVLGDKELYDDIKSIKQRTVLYQKVKRRIHYLNSLPYQEKLDLSDLEEKLAKAKEAKSKPKKQAKPKKVKKAEPKKIKSKKIKPAKALKPKKKTRAKKRTAKKRPSKKILEQKQKEVRDIIHHPTKIKAGKSKHHQTKKNKYFEPHFNEQVKATIAEFGLGIAVGLIAGLIMASYLL